MDEAAPDLVDAFPGLGRLDSLRYKNIMFLDQVSAKEIGFCLAVIRTFWFLSLVGSLVWVFGLHPDTNPIKNQFGFWIKNLILYVLV